MAFSSDWSQPTNSNHHHELHESIVSGHGLLSHHQLPPLQQNPNANHHHVASSGGFPARHGGSMVEKARQAKLFPPKEALNCPRCNSTNTKFCYYNNYNLAQPRHYCKACRRYWTQGGAQREVPVGGSCRKNSKKGKNGNSKTPSSSLTKQSSSSTAPSPSLGKPSRTTNNQFPFPSPALYNLTQLGGIGLNLSNNQAHHNNIGSSLMNDLGFLNVGSRQNTSSPMSRTIQENNNNNGNNIMESIGSLGHFTTVFDPTTSLYPLQNESNVEISSSSASLVDYRVYQSTAPMKMEEQPTNLARPVSGLTSLGNQTNQLQYFWPASDFSGPSNELL